MSNLNNDNNKDLSNNKIINNTADLSKNILKIDISNNYPRFTLDTTNRYFLNLNNNTHNSKLPPLHTPKEKKLRNNVIYKSNKESDTNDIDMKIRNLIDKIRQERLNFSKKIDAYENKKKDISYNFTYTGVNTIYKDFTRSTERNYTNLINKLDTKNKPRVTYTDNSSNTSTTQNTDRLKDHNKRINEMRKFIRGTTDLYNKYYDSSSYHGINNEPLKPPILSPTRRLKDDIFTGKEHPDSVLLPKLEKKLVNIDVTIETIDDILNLIDEYPIQYDIEYNINMQALHNIKEPLIKLNKMIGMKSLKTNILDQILYFVQDLHKNEETIETDIVDVYGRVIGKTTRKINKGGDFLHTCIYGPPGTGKTEVAKIMGSIFSKLGVLKKNVFKKVTRADLIAGYLGQTAMKTRDAVKDCLGGVMFIDEAYALGNPEKRDSFAKECIDTLCEALSDHKDELMVIIAGYEKELQKCFFSFNQGLDSRFTWRFKTDDYSADELRQIFTKKVNENGWSIEKDSIKTEWFENNKDFFKFYGRDMENLFSKVKIAHSRRVFCLPPDKKKTINDVDLEKGLEMFLSNEDVKKRKADKEKYEELKYSIYT